MKKNWQEHDDLFKLYVVFKCHFVAAKALTLTLFARFFILRIVRAYLFASNWLKMSISIKKTKFVLSKSCFYYFSASIHFDLFSDMKIEHKHERNDQ